MQRTVFGEEEEVSSNNLHPTPFPEQQTIRQREGAISEGREIFDTFERTQRTRLKGIDVVTLEEW